MKDIFFNTKKLIESFGFNIVGFDFDRPWGWFFIN